MRPVLAGTIALLPAALAACAGSGGGEGQRNLSGFPPAFQQGYVEGCRSAGARSVTRDEGRFRTDNDYMRGWNDGYGVCRGGR